MISERLGRIEYSIAALATAVHDGFARIERTLDESDRGTYYVPVPRAQDHGNGGTGA